MGCHADIFSWSFIISVGCWQPFVQSFKLMGGSKAELANFVSGIFIKPGLPGFWHY